MDNAREALNATFEKYKTGDKIALEKLAQESNIPHYLLRIVLIAASCISLEDIEADMQVEAPRPELCQNCLLLPSCPRVAK